MLTRTLTLVTAILLWMMTGHALGATPDAATVQLTAYRVTTVQTAEGAAERLQPVKTVAPGDVIEYQAVYRNGNATPARNVQVTLPVPSGGLEYVPLPTAGTSPLASVDGVTFQPMPLVRTEKLPGGRTVQRPVPPAEYRFLRWSLGDLPAGGTRSVSARMQLPYLSR